MTGPCQLWGKGVRSMRYSQLHDGALVPVFGLGTGDYGHDPSRVYQELRSLRSALEMGYTLIDTAEAYGDGRSEELIGQAIDGLDRSKLFITTKVRETHLHYRDVMKAIEGSLRRLHTGYVDLYLIHAPNPAVPLEETFEALNDLVENGKTRYIGVSNFSREQMMQAYRLTKSILATNQVEYSLFSRDPEENGVLDFCQQNDVILTAYSPLEDGGLFSREPI